MAIGSVALNRKHIPVGLVQCPEVILAVLFKTAAVEDRAQIEIEPSRANFRMRNEGLPKFIHKLNHLQWSIPQHGWPYNSRNVFWMIDVFILQ